MPTTNSSSGTDKQRGMLIGCEESFGYVSRVGHGPRPFEVHTHLAPPSQRVQSNVLAMSDVESEAAGCLIASQLWLAKRSELESRVLGSDIEIAAEKPTQQPA